MATARLALAAALLAAGAAFAQAPAEPPRPKVCLVLSGGGARGAAHVGVIKVLEELRVPIDCIAGTSMGSLVGGGYASGMTIAQMEKLLGGITSDLLFKEQPPRQDQSIRRKQDDRSILFGFEVGLRDQTLLLQKGAVSGVQLETVLRSLAKVEGFRKFDALSIPYRAVATDLVSGKPVVFSEGELANVMRASMSVPVAIAPVEIEGRLLVDGGLTNNLPVNVARAMGADIVIAVNLGTPLLTREGVGSVLGVSAQMINILTEQNVQASIASLRPTDILIEPALGNFSASDFDHLLDTVPIGEAATRAAAPRLAALSLAPEQYAALQRRRAIPPPPDLRPVDEIRFAGLTRVNPESMLGLMDTAPRQAIDVKVLDTDMRRLFGTGDFEHVTYRIVEEDGKRILRVDAAEKSWGPNYLRFGLSLSSDFGGESYYNLAASYRRTWINSLGGEWRTDIQLGKNSFLSTELYQPLLTQRYLFVSPRAAVERHTVDLFNGSQRIARYDLRSRSLGLDLGTDLTKYGEIRLGLVRGSVDARLDTGPQELAPPPDRIPLGAVTFRAVVDQIDNINFPREGFGGNLRLYGSRKTLGAEDDYTKWTADGGGAISFGGHTLQLYLRGGGAVGNGSLPRYDLLQWGGFLQQSGYPTGALVGQELAFGRLVYTNRLHHQPLLDGIYVGASLEVGRMGHPLVVGSPTGTLKSAAVFFGVDSPVGPIYLGYGRAADGNSSAYFFLGRP